MLTGSGTITTRKRLTPAKEKIIAAAQDYKCATCRMILPSTWELDHKIELWQGGTNELDNFQVLCPNCHRKKSQLAAIAREDLKRAALPVIACPVASPATSPHFNNNPSAAATATPIPPFVKRRNAEKSKSKSKNWGNYFCCSSSADKEV